MILLLLLFSSTANAIDFMGLHACSRRYADMARLADTAFEKYPALLALKKAMEQETFQGKMHSNLLLPVGGKFKLQIGGFSRDSKKMNALMLRAIREGGISEIDAGNVVGPKVISLLRRFEKEFVETKRDVVIRGMWMPWLIRREFNSQVSNPVNRSQYFWTAQEKTDFLAASERYGVLDCYKKLKIQEVNPCEFRLTINDGISRFEYLSSGR